MNERQFHDLVRDWLIAEAPSEAPDWILQASTELTETMQRRSRSLGSRGLWQAATIAIVLGVLTAGAISLAALLPRPPAPPPTPRTDLQQTLPLGGGRPVGVTALGNDLWFADASLPGAVRIDRDTGERTAEVTTHARPPARLDLHPLVSDIIAAFDSIWTVDEEFGTVTRIDDDTATVVATVEVGGYPSTAIAAAGSVWTLDAHLGSVTRIDPLTNATDSITLPRSSAQGIGHIAGDDDTIWLAIDDEVLRIETATHVVEVVAQLPEQASGLAVADAIWVSTSQGIVRVEPATNQAAAPMAVGGDPGALAYLDGTIWVADRRDGSVRAIDPVTLTVLQTIEVGGGATDIGVLDATLFVLNQLDGTVSLLDAGG